jgi:hypothetical protein
MKKTFYSLLVLAALIFLGSPAGAQSDLGPRKNTQRNLQDESQVLSS